MRSSNLKQKRCFVKTILPHRGVLGNAYAFKSRKSVGRIIKLQAAVGQPDQMGADHFLLRSVRNPGKFEFLFLSGAAAFLYKIVGQFYILTKR